VRERSVGDAARAVVELTGGSVAVEGGQRDGGVGPLGDGLVPLWLLKSVAV
jgi:hypothetical protein